MSTAERTPSSDSNTLAPSHAPSTDQHADHEVKGPVAAHEDLEKDGSSPLQKRVSTAPTFPDGGWAAWSTVAGCWLVLFCTFGYVNAFGVYEEFYLRTTGETASTIAWIGSLQLFFQFVLGGVTGPLFDKGHFRSTTIVGSVVYAFGLFMTSLCTKYYQIILAQGVTAGLGVGILFLPCLGVLAQHFQRRRALATGIVASGSSVGGVVWPIMLNNLFNGSVGFAWGVRASAFMVLGLLAVAQLLMRTRFEALGRHAKKRPDMKSIFADRVFQSATLGLFLILLGIFIGFFYSQVFATSHGLSQDLAFYSLAILNAASIFGRTLPGLVADKLGCFNCLITCATITGILVLVLPATGSPGAFIAWCILYGFFSGSYISLLTPSLMTTARHPSEIGARIGLPMMFLAIAGLVGTPINGALLGDGNPIDYPWWKSSTFSGVVVLAGCAVLVYPRILMASRKGTQNV